MSENKSATKDTSLNNVCPPPPPEVVGRKYSGVVYTQPRRRIAPFVG